MPDQKIIIATARDQVIAIVAIKIVMPGAAKHGVISLTADQHAAEPLALNHVIAILSGNAVVVTARIQPVMPRPANDRIGASSPPDQVAAAVAAHDIAAIARGGDDIIALMPDQDIATVAAVDTVSAVASEDLIGVIAPHQPIMSRPADDSILSGAPLDKVCLLPIYQVIALG